jgi:hypothetical protein
MEVTLAWRKYNFCDEEHREDLLGVYASLEAARNRIFREAKDDTETRFIKINEDLYQDREGDDPVYWLETETWEVQHN